MKPKINTYKRYQKGLSMEDLFPIRQDKTCACGCGTILTGRQTKWASKLCLRASLTQFYIIKGDTSVIREELFKIDKGVCRLCNCYHPYWQADHIKSVIEGGGASPLDNFQTLCPICHQHKTRLLYAIPNGSDIFASRLNIPEFCFNMSRRFNKGISKNIIGNTIRIPRTEPFRHFYKI